jgi:hypothetical protein
VKAVVAATRAMGFVGSRMTHARVEWLTAGLAFTATAARPAETAATPQPAAPHVENLGGTRRALGRIQFDIATREILVPAKINMTRGVIEYALVHDLGKVHESLLSTTVTPFELNVVLLLLNYQPDAMWHVPPAKPKPAEDARRESLCRIAVRWSDPNGGSEKSAPIESWVWNLGTKAIASDGPWVYTGSTATVDGRFAAQVDGTHVALYLDPRCLFNNPRPGNNDDQLWEPARNLPPKDTPVTVVFRPQHAKPAGARGPKPAEHPGRPPAPPADLKRDKPKS